MARQAGGPRNSVSADFLTSVLAAPRPGDALLAWHAEHKTPSLMEYSGIIPAGPAPWHNDSVFEHLAYCMDAVAGDPLAVWLALAHDSGKLTTPKALWPHHYAHEERGARIAPIWARQLGLPPSWGEAGSIIACEHMRAGRYRALKPGKKYSLLLKIMPQDFAAPFWLAVNADAGAPVSIFAAHDWQIVSKALENGLSREQILPLLKKVGAF